MVQQEAEVHPFPGEEHLPSAAPSWRSWVLTPKSAKLQGLQTSVVVPLAMLSSKSMVVQFGRTNMELLGVGGGLGFGDAMGEVPIPVVTFGNCGAFLKEAIVAWSFIFGLTN